MTELQSDGDGRRLVLPEIPEMTTNGIKFTHGYTDEAKNADFEALMELSRIMNPDTKWLWGDVTVEPTVMFVEEHGLPIITRVDIIDGIRRVLEQ